MRILEKIAFIFGVTSPLVCFTYYAGPKAWIDVFYLFVWIFTLPLWMIAFPILSLVVTRSIAKRKFSLFSVQMATIIASCVLGSIYWVLLPRSSTESADLALLGVPFLLSVFIPLLMFTCLFGLSLVRKTRSV